MTAWQDETSRKLQDDIANDTWVTGKYCNPNSMENAGTFTQPMKRAINWEEKGVLEKEHQTLLIKPQIAHFPGHQAVYAII
ncbi:hypothetical protein Hamer_G009659 [Homarus americanus]|uniref:Uncharacterized protein n=1 Tax=Homarus americanus TaxID=6706 RepID=A0A8J5N390_HOMAM|nr:hypothetical protein Hamer_G009659 [Homarus americanus]